jgi:hypothetical protein
MFWFSDNGFIKKKKKKKGKVGRVFISNPTWEGFLYFVFIFSSLKTTQTSSILLFWQKTTQ